MPGSQTTRGGAEPRVNGSAPVAFCCHDGIGTPGCIAFAAHNLACTHPCQRFVGNLAALTHDSGPVWDATPFTVMDSHPLPPAGLPAHRGSISHPTQSLCTLRGRRRRRAHATLATGRVLPLTRAGLSRHYGATATRLRFLRATSMHYRRMPLPAAAIDCGRSRHKQRGTPSWAGRSRSVAINVGPQMVIVIPSPMIAGRYV